MRFHVLGIPHTISKPEYSSCAFTQKVVKLCKMLTAEGHQVFHYGHAASEVECWEHVTVTQALDLKKSYPTNNWRRDGFPAFAQTDEVYKTFYRNAIEEIGRRKQPNDFLLCAFGDWHKPVALAHPDLITVESGIGYPNGVFAKYRVFESYAIMHAYQGNTSACTARNDHWYDVVIPNQFNLAEFEFSAAKSDYFLFLGRLNSGKGIHIAKQIAETTKTKLIVAGAGKREMDTEFVKYVGVVGPEKRCELLRDARATICASTFLEPFCGVQIESMLSGTPVISSNWGAFTEYNIQGKTGYRCNTFEQFVWAANNIGQIEPVECRKWAKQFSLEAVAPRYTDYFRSVLDVHQGNGWYEPREDRTHLF